MAVVNDQLYENEYNCLTTDLIDGFPSDSTLEVGSIMYVYDVSTKSLSSIFKLHKASGTKEWYKVYST